MGYNKINNLLGKLDKDENPKLTTIKWIEIFDQSNGTYNPNKDIRFKIPQIRDHLCDFNDTYIVVTGKITVANPGNDINVYNRNVALKNSAPFINCILKINNQLIEDAQDLLMPVFNLLYCSKNFRKTTGSFWNYCPDKPNSGYTHTANIPIARIPRDRIFRSVYNSGSFNYKAKFINTSPAADDPDNADNIERELEDIKNVPPLKSLSNFIFRLNFLMINTEIELVSKFCIDFKSNKRK